MNVLLVEDSPVDALLIRELLAEVPASFDLIYADRLSTGLERLAAGGVDVILLDLSLPDSQGLSTLERTRAQAPDVPIIVLTGLDDDAVAVGAVHRGAQDYLIKGQVDGRLLVRSIRYAVERKRTEEEIRRQREALLRHEKLAAMTSILSGVAHELNSPLSVILGQTALLRRTAGDGVPARRAGKISDAAERCARIVKNFLALAWEHPPERQQVRLNRVVEGAVELLAYPLRMDNVEVRLELAPDLPVLWADPHQLHQVMVNLITNAHQAMRETPAPRRLTLSTRYEKGLGSVLLEVADTGPGIPTAIQKQIFEPFFTTTQGQGTGLGLSLCQGIIEGHAGTITVESEPGQGARFRIELPVEASPEVPPPEALGAPGGKAILVVDDEPEIAEVLVDMFTADGHEVETASNGALALAKIEARAYDLILSDVKMPELDGPGLYRELERCRPGLCRRVIFLTGDTLGRETREFLKRTGVPSLSKPFVFEEVRRMVQQTLEAE